MKNLEFFNKNSKMIRRKHLLPLPHPNYPTEIEDVVVTHPNVEDDVVREQNIETENVVMGEQNVEDVVIGEQSVEDVVFESEDSDYIYKDDSCEEIIDDIIFKENVDQDVEWVGTKEGNNKGESSNTSDMEDDISSESDFDSLGSDNGEEDCIGESERVSTSTSNNPQFHLGQIFGTKHQFKDAVNSYSVQIGRPSKFIKNDTRRIYARCKNKDDGCMWHINALKVKDELSFQIREMDLTHTCARQYHVDNANSRWLAHRFEKSFRCDPKKSVKGFRNSAISELGVYISPYQAWRARQKALKLIEGDTTEQYSKLWDYAETLREKNPGSTVILQLDDTPAGKKFKRIYVCLAAVKNGFLSGCRPWIGVDGCHLRGLCSGVLLTAVSMDPNNDPYPLAYAVVEVENKDSWEWFLQLLKEDLIHEREDAYTFMSDKQKGLIGAFEKVLPGVENRFCVRHLHGNMKRAGFRGNVFKKLLWKAANATTVAAFNTIMLDFEKLDKNCLEWLQKGKSATEWSKSHFSTFGKCDTLVNNMCEQFNSCLVDAREKPILTMLEWIREYMMSRLQKNRDRAELKWEGRQICGRIRMIIEKNVKAAADCIPIKSNEYNYEISSFDGSRYAVNLKAHTCDCRKWELSGIPCKHAMSAICAERCNPEHYVHTCYSVNTYMAVYSHAISPMNGEELWQKTGYIPPLPPNFARKKKGRPKKDKRFDTNEEPKKKKRHGGNLQKMAKQKFKVTCQFCGGEGHNRLGCRLRKNENANSEIAKSEVEEERRQPEIVQETQPEAEETTQPEVDVITQTDYPDLTQENQDVEMMESSNEFVSNVDSRSTNKPTTVQGRKMLARKRAELANKDPREYVSQEMLAPYSISNSIKATQPKEMGVQIRAPPQMSFHPQHFIGAPSGGVGAEKGKDGESMKVFTEGGKRFVTLSSLRAASHARRGESAPVSGPSPTSNV